MLEAAARLFADQGVDHVSLRDIASEANVQLPLIRRYVGLRHEVIDAVFHRLNGQVAAYARTNPLEQFEYGRDSILGRWMAMSTYYASRGELPPSGEDNPVRSLAEVFERSFGLDHRAARLRAMQVVAITMGWRLFEDYLQATAHIEDLTPDDLRLELNAMQRRIGSTPWPTPLVAPDQSGERVKPANDS